MNALTGVCLNPSGDLSSTDVIEVGDLLTKNGSEIRFTEALGANFRSVDPNRHKGKVRDEHGDTCETVKLSSEIN